MKNNRIFKTQTPVATIYIEETQPSANKRPEVVEHLFHFRKEKEFSGNNVVAIADMKEAMWWNRPQPNDTTSAWGVEKDGLPCCNVPTLFSKEHVWKSKYNILVNRHNVPTIIQIRFEHPLTTEELRKLYSMTVRVITQTLIRLGVVEQDLCHINNDLLLKGKKIMGTERTYDSATKIYTEALFITLKYQEEKDIFMRLSHGKVAATAKREITGLIDEYPAITKEDFLKIYCEEFKKYLDQFTL